MTTFPTAPSETGDVPTGMCYAAALAMEPSREWGRLGCSGATLAVVSGVFPSAVVAVVNEIVSGGAIWAW